MGKYFYKIIIGLVFLVMAYMIFDLFLFGVNENVERYWIMVLICIAISYAFTEVFVRIVESRSNEDNPLKKQKVINFDDEKTRKITLYHPGSC